MIANNDFNYNYNYAFSDNCFDYYDSNFSELRNLRYINTSYGDIVTAYSNAITNYIRPILFKIPNITEEEINNFSYFTTDVLRMLVTRIETSLGTQDSNTSALAEHVSRLYYNESKKDFAFAKQSDVQNLCENLRNQLIKDFDDKIKTILEHEIQSDKSSTELLGIIFPEDKDNSITNES